MASLTVADENRLQAELIDLLQADLARKGALLDRIGILYPCRDLLRSIEPVKRRSGRKNHHTLRRAALSHKRIELLHILMRA